MHPGQLAPTADMGINGLVEFVNGLLTVLQLTGCTAAQGALGYVQYFMGLPQLLVALHMLGSALMWICVLQVAARGCRWRWPIRPGR
ncbi:hypothetical protein AB0D26_17920 [Streptomyces libani]